MEGGEEGRRKDYTLGGLAVVYESGSKQSYKDLQ